MAVNQYVQSCTRFRPCEIKKLLILGGIRIKSYAGSSPEMTWGWIEGENYAVDFLSFKDTVASKLHMAFVNVGLRISCSDTNIHLRS